MCLQRACQETHEQPQTTASIKVPPTTTTLLVCLCLQDVDQRTQMVMDRIAYEKDADELAAKGEHKGVKCCWVLGAC
jgi:hypothetical protein